MGGGGGGGGGGMELEVPTKLRQTNQNSKEWLNINGPTLKQKTKQSF